MRIHSVGMVIGWWVWVGVGYELTRPRAVWKASTAAVNAAHFAASVPRAAVVTAQNARFALVGDVPRVVLPVPSFCARNVIPAVGAAFAASVGVWIDEFKRSMH